MPYTREDAAREVGDSKDWPVGLEASIKKWEQRAGGNLGSYGNNERCGLCFVAANRGIVNCADGACLASSICKGGSFTIHTPKEILQALKNLRKELKMDCSELCANFKPRDESPFPKGLKTEDLKVGMVVRKGNVYNGPIHTILEQPRNVWVRVLSAWPCHPPREAIIRLADQGCQPYNSGHWSPSNWLREVK